MSQIQDDNQSLKALKKDLQSKNEVIAALTEQLEGTVDQLDRLQRSGVRENSGEAARRSGLGLAGQVETALEVFDELDPAERFERIESGIDLILEALSNGASVEFSKESEEVQEDTQSEAVQAEEPSEDDFWKATKERLLETAEHVETEETVEAPTYESGRPDENIVSQSTVKRRVPLPPLADPPKPMESLHGPVALEEGVTERDSYIVSLIARLRVLEESQFPPINWSELSNAPEKLKASLILLEKQLRDNLLRAEVSVALERASLTRERSKLFYVKRQLEQEVKRIGLTSIVESQKQGGDPSENSRWAKFFDTE